MGRREILNGKEDLMADRLIDIKELSERICLKPKTIRNLLHEGGFPLRPVKQGGRRNFWKESEVELYIMELGNSGSGKH